MTVLDWHIEFIHKKRSFPRAERTARKLDSAFTGQKNPVVGMIIYVGASFPLCL